MYAMFEYSTDLFARATIERMAGHFQVLLEAIVADPAQPVTLLPLLTAPERQQLLVDWNNTGTGPNDIASYQRLFEAQVAHTPEAEAVHWQPAPGAPLTRLTYRELNERANQLAHALRTHGVGTTLGPETIVGVCLERSLDTLVSLLAIFKAGGAYLPLDPAFPDARLATIIAHADLRLVVTRAQYALRLAEPAVGLICTDRDSELLGQQPTTNLSIDTRPSQLAYVLFTSGSTGQPKGVMIEQRSLLNNLRAKIHDHGLSATDKLAQTAPTSFDISIWQFLTALLVGGTVRIFDDETVRDPTALLRCADAEGVTVLQVVPSLFSYMLEQVALAGVQRPTFAALRWLSSVGEALSSTLCNAWLAHYPHIPILNAYGPAECGDNVTHAFIRAPLPPERMSASIGTPRPNVRVYVLDPHMQPVPLGVMGELYVGGLGVGRGYLHDAERTAAAFLGDPFVPDPQARLYKTGDLARYLPDGTLEYLGRLDHQIKLRGFRIELGEIEAVLNQHPAVEKSVATVHTAANGEQQLVAYLALSQPQAPLVEAAALKAAQLVPQWREFLAARLPGYMVPSQFVVLDALPLTPNGKIDRQRLPAPDPSQRLSASGYAPPRTPTEALLAKIWCEVLRIEQVGIYDNFFTIGGHSLLATQVVSRLRQQFQVELPLRTIFGAPTIAELAEQVEAIVLTQTIQQMDVDPAIEREEIMI